MECRKGQTVRTRIDRGAPEAVRVLPPGVAYPANYGYAEGTRAADGEAIDVFLLGDPVAPLTRVRGRVIAAIEFWDARGEDEKLVALPVAATGPRRPGTEDLGPDLGAEMGRIAAFLEAYKPPEAPHRVGRLLGPPEAWSLLRRARVAGAAAAEAPVSPCRPGEVPPT